MLVVAGVVLALVGLASDRESGQSESGQDVSEPCLRPSDGSPAAGARPAVIALIGDDVNRSGEFEGPHVHRLLRISLPGGEVRAERALGQRLPNRAVDRDESFRLNAARAPLIAQTGDGATVVALVREPAPRRETFATIDAASLETRCSHPLEKGVRYSGMLLGRSGTVYAFGTRATGIGRRRHAVLTVADAETGDLLGSHTLRKAYRGKWTGSGTDWFVYGGALSQDERRIVLGYHGHDTTGADLFAVSPEKGVSAAGPAERRCAGRPPRDRCWSRSTDIDGVHGAVAAGETGFVGAAESQGLLELDRRGRVVGRVHVSPESHLMDFAFDRGRSLIYVSICGKRPTIQRLDLRRGRHETMRSGAFCGNPLVVHADRFLVLSASRVSKRGYPVLRPQRLRLIDLEHPGPGEEVPRPGAPLDAIVVR